ncbi:hypothetical protein TrLO_g6087 [Triparma laevis f. longispina]|uniref:Serine/threonine protein phosphatase 2A regulatory subunit n=1 Tax=Triparma laevis f. longispina TaxID=1714387 RepID=A0A9W7CK25_9STRA|nr:hypothetical protein TrLO_g6087 [Triparma laevis f. longispina]
MGGGGSKTPKSPKNSAPNTPSSKGGSSGSFGPDSGRSTRSAKSSRSEEKTSFEVMKSNVSGIRAKMSPTRDRRAYVSKGSGGNKKMSERTMTTSERGIRTMKSSPMKREGNKFGLSPMAASPKSPKSPSEEKSGGSNLDSAFSFTEIPEDDQDVDFPHSMWQNLEFMDKNLPTLEDTDPDKREELIVTKLHLCTIVYDHRNAELDVEEKKVQMKTLKELKEYVEDPPLDDNGVFTDVIFANLVNCFEEQAFQPLSIGSETVDLYDSAAMKESGMLVSNDDSMKKFLEPAWPYLKILYELFLKYINRMKGAIVKELVDKRLCGLLIERFNSSDHRERDMLRSIILRIYNKFMEHRPAIRSFINTSFYRFIYETGKHNGVTELLMVLEPIINGFKAPLKQEHLDMLEKTLIPLHKAPHQVMQTYHKELKKLLGIFMDKDPDRCGAIIIRRIAAFWPLRHGPKQVAMINELEDILEHITKEMWQEGELAKTRKLFYKLLNHIVGSEHFQVAERGLKLWQNRFLYDGCFNRHEFSKEILDIAFTQLYFKSHDHWQNNDGLKGEGKEVVGCKVGDLALKVLYGYKKSELEYYETLKKAYGKARSSGTQKKEKHSNFFHSDERWGEIEKLAAKNRGEEVKDDESKEDGKCEEKE